MPPVKPCRELHTNRTEHPTTGTGLTLWGLLDCTQQSHELSCCGCACAANAALAKCACSRLHFTRPK